MRKVNLEIALYMIAFALALGLRLYNLGAAPLTDSEAKWALEALQVARPTGVNPIGPQPAYVFLTGISFKLFGTSNFLARFWPAMAGSLLVLAPFSIKRPLGRATALILAFGLALDPGLIAISRMAGSSMMAVGFGISALALWFGALPILAGFLGGVALLSGPAVFAGILGLGITALVAYFSLSREQREDIFQGRSLDLALFSGLTTFLTVGSLFFQYPQGLSAWFESLLVYLNGWRTPSGVPASRLVAALIFFQPFALIFVLAGIIRWLIRLARETGHKVMPFGLSLVWLLSSLVLALLYPARQVTDLAWTLVPLWILAAVELTEYLPERKPHPISLVLATLVLLFGALLWSTLVATDQAMPLVGVSWAAVRLGVIAGVITLGILTTALVALGWSWRVSRDGAVWGLSLAFGVYLMMVTWSASQLRPNYPQELWSNSPPIQQADLFTKTLDELSNWDTGFVNHIDVLATVDTPSLRWVLRDYQNVEYSTRPPIGKLPSVVITSGFIEESQAQADFPELSVAYRGQDFAWWVLPSWSGALPPDIVRWLAFREAPLQRQHIILWVQSDMFSGGTTESLPQFENIE